MSLIATPHNGHAKFMALTFPDPKWNQNAEECSMSRVNGQFISVPFNQTRLLSIPCYSMSTARCKSLITISHFLTYPHTYFQFEVSHCDPFQNMAGELLEAHGSSKTDSQPHLGFPERSEKCQHIQHETPSASDSYTIFEGCMQKCGIKGSCPFWRPISLMLIMGFLNYWPTRKLGLTTAQCQPLHNHAHTSNAMESSLHNPLHAPCVKARLKTYMINTRKTPAQTTSLRV